MSLNYAILSLEITSKRMCGIRLIREDDLDMLLLCVYMTCDTVYDMSDVNEYNSILQEMTYIWTILDVNKLIISGDFDMEFTRSSLYIQGLGLHSSR